MAKKTVGTQSVSGASGAAKPEPSVEYSQDHLTVTDGTTSAEYDSTRDPVLSALHEKVPTIGDMSHPEKQHYPPCINPTCKSYGKSHPNCLCYAGPGGSSLEAGFFAHGGKVCSGMHLEDCEHYADGGTIAENQKFHQDPTDVLDHIAIHHGLLGLLTKTGHSGSKDKHKHFEDYRGHSKKGHNLLHNHMENLFVPNELKPSKESREALKAHLNHLREKPEDLLDVGGGLGDVLPHHGIQLAAKAGTAVNYLEGLRPKQAPTNPLDTPQPEDKIAEGHYDRHIDIAQQPLMILQHFKDGTLRPDDIQTLHTLYPGLSKEITQKAFEQLIQAKEKKMEIPYKQKQTLSLILGQPLDFTMTPQAMHAVMASSGPQQMRNQQKAQGKPKKASGAELNQINKVNELSATQLQDRQMDKLKD